MKTEIEAKWLGIDPQSLRLKLKKVGAQLVHPEVLMRRKIFDYPDERLKQVGGWVRVRDESSKITLSYKQLNDRSLHGTQEVTVVVNDFDATCELLADIGLVEQSYQETRRELWTLGNAEVTIDSWPWIPTFVEIEADSEDLLRSTAEQLALDWSQAMHGSVETAYQRYYDVTEAEIDAWPKITFEVMPEGLMDKKRTNEKN